MRAARLHVHAAPLLVEDVPVVQPPPGAVLVRVEAAFVPPFMAGVVAGPAYATPPLPFTPGIDAVGRVDRVGQDVSGLQPGERVYCNPFHMPGGGGAPRQRAFIGSFALGAQSASLLAQWRDGAYAEMVLLPQECVIGIPEDVTAPASALCRLGWLGTAHAAFRKSAFAAGDTVIVHGATGLLGSSATVLALALGANSVQVTGRDEAALARLAAIDPRIVVIDDPDQAEPSALLLSCVSGGESEALARLLLRLDIGGHCIVIGAPANGFMVDPGRLLRDEVAIRGSLWHGRQDIDALFALCARGALDLSLFTPCTFPLEEVNEALDASQLRTDPLAHVALEWRPPA
jgi:NADPH:quinone reductase-like Zn-dependent oxidoreductase